MNLKKVFCKFPILQQIRYYAAHPRSCCAIFITFNKKNIDQCSMLTRFNCLDTRIPNSSSCSKLSSILFRIVAAFQRMYEKQIRTLTWDRDNFENVSSKPIVPIWETSMLCKTFLWHQNDSVIVQNVFVSSKWFTTVKEFIIVVKFCQKYIENHAKVSVHLLAGRSSPTKSTHALFTFQNHFQNSIPKQINWVGLTIQNHFKVFKLYWSINSWLPLMIYMYNVYTPCTPRK